MAHVVLGFVLNQRVVNSFAEDPPERESPRAGRGRGRAAARAARRDRHGVRVAGLAQLRHAAEVAADRAARRRHRAVQHDCLGLPRLRRSPGAAPTTERAEGIAILQRLLKVAPNHPSFPFWHYFLSFAHTEGGDYRAAREHAQFAINIHPGFCLGWVLLANALGALGDDRGRARSPLRRRSRPTRASGRTATAATCWRSRTRSATESVRRQTDGLVRAGLIPPLSEVSAA